MMYSGGAGFGGAGFGYSGFGGGAYASPYQSYGGGLSGYSSGQLFTSAPQFAQYGGFSQAYAQPSSPQLRSGVVDFNKDLLVVSPQTGGYSSYGGYQAQVQPQVRQQIAVAPQPQSYSGYGFPQYSSYGGYGQMVSPQIYQQQGGQQYLQRSPSGLSGFSSGMNFGSAAVGGQQFQQVQPQQQQQQVRALPSSAPGQFQIPRVNAVPAQPQQARPAAAAPRPAAPPSNDGDVARDYWGRPLNGVQAPPRQPGLANSARTGERPQDWKHLMTGEQK